MIALGCTGMYSCSDMIETDSTRMVVDPNLDQKTDSVFYAYGILQAMQQLADQYYYQNEVRGDLVATIPGKSSQQLVALGNYSADETNQYDSTYLYYKVINNCNYYLAHRDTTLYNASTNVTLTEYAAVAAIRAWAYLQMARQYETVSYMETPVTSIADVEADYPKYNLRQVLEAQIAYLKQFAGYDVPTFGGSNVSAGTTNWGQSKSFSPARCFVPVDVILGEMYLELGQYENAARSYFNYLIRTKRGVSELRTCISFASNSDFIEFNNKQIYAPDDYDATNRSNLFASTWNSIFNNSATPADVITYIPMAVSNSRGYTTTVPDAYGYNYYSTSRSGACPHGETVQLKPSAEFYLINDSTDYYYYPIKDVRGVSAPKPAKMCDARSTWCLQDGLLSNGDSAVFVQKVRTATIYLYRNTTVYLHLAEALNRMGYPDAAFMILKDGLSERAATFFTLHDYIQPATVEMLKTKIPFFSAENQATTIALDNIGIHSRGCGEVRSGTLSLYTYDAVVGTRMNRIAKELGVTMTNCKEDSINAVEDLLCDEYAMEFAFEGTRFSDLQRLARHKNESNPYGSATFGSKWLGRKMSFKGLDENFFLDQKNWYLPFN